MDLRATDLLGALAAPQPGGALSLMIAYTAPAGAGFPRGVPPRYDGPMLRRLRTLHNRLRALRGARAGGACPVCDDRALRPRHADPHRFLLACQGCGHIWAPAPPDPGTLRRLHGRQHLRAIEEALGGGPGPGGWEGWARFKEQLLLDLGLEALERAAAGRPEALDIGCGHGKLLELLQRRGWRCTGVDFSDGVAGLPRPRGINVIQADITTHYLPPRRFLLVAMTHVLEHLADPARVLRQVGQALTGPGRLLLEVPLFVEEDDLCHQRFFSPHSLQLLVQRAGLRPLERRTYADALNPARENLVLLCGAAG